ncbi:MAG: CoxG family protein [Salinirussus sp.]
MEFEGDFTCDGTPEELWPYFTDTDVLADSVPGCKEMVPVTPSEIETTLAVGVGSVKPTFDATAIVLEADRPNRLEMQATGEASRNSFTANAWTELHDNGDGTTTVTWGSTAEVSGIIASMGERALGSVANKLVNDYFENIETAVNEGVPAESELAAADPEVVAELRADDGAEADEADESDEGRGLLGRLGGQGDEQSEDDEDEEDEEEAESESDDGGGGLRDRLSRS